MSRSSNIGYGSLIIQNCLNGNNEEIQETPSSEPPTSEPFCKKVWRWFSLMSVEPTMFLYMIAYSLTSVIEQSFYVHKACIANHNLSEEICNDLNNPIYSNMSIQVQVTVSNFHQWSGIAAHVFPFILAFFLGAWSDKRGRKVVMLSGLLGRLWFSLMIVINNVQTDWPLEYIIYTATIPCALTGADVAIFAGAFSYIADITTPEDRTLRIGILDVIYLSSLPIGIYTGSVLFKLFNQSYTIMFLINATCMVLSLIYTVIKLKWQTNDNQKSLSEAGVRNPLKDFFDLNHVKNSFTTLLKRRAGHRRTFIWLLLLGMLVYTFQRDEKPMLYLYTTKVFGWDVTVFSMFKTYYSTFFVFVMLIGIPAMSRVLKWRDTFIAMMGALSHILGRIFFAGAKDIWMMYIGATAAALGPCVAPVIRSMASKAVEPKEKGKMYAVLSVCDNAVGLISSMLYTQIYNATISTEFPNSIFFLTIGTQVIVFICALIIHLMLRGESMDHHYCNQEENKEKLSNAIEDSS